MTRETFNVVPCFVRTDCYSFKNNQYERGNDGKYVVCRDYRISWNLFYTELSKHVDSAVSMDFSSLGGIWHDPARPANVRLGHVNMRPIETDEHHEFCLDNALLHATCSTKDKWKVPKRWQVVELLINSGAGFTATSGVFFKEYAIDRMIAGHAPEHLIALALKKGAWVGRNKNLLKTIDCHYADAVSVRLKDAITNVVSDMTTLALQSEFAKHADTAIANVCNSVIEKVSAEVTRFFGPHSKNDIIGVATQRVLDAFKRRYVLEADQGVANIVHEIRMSESINASALANRFVREYAPSAAGQLFIKRKLLRQVALRFVDEKGAELREKNPQADLDVVINDLFIAFKRIVKYDNLERCVQLDVENALKERVRQTSNSIQNLAGASNKAVPAVSNASATGVVVVGMFAGGARAALAAAPVQPDNKARYYAA